MTILGLIVAIDATIIVLVMVPGLEFGILAILLGLVHAIVSMNLLIVLQEGVKAEEVKTKDAPDNISSSGRVLTGRDDRGYDSVLCDQDASAF